MILGINPYFIFDGRGREAINFYKEALDAEVLGVQTYRDLPENPETPIPDAVKDHIIHAYLKIGETDLMISDTFPGPHQQPLKEGNQVTVAVTMNSVEKSKEVFEKLKEGGHVTMELDETFFSPAYGQVTDQFNVSWHVSTYQGEKNN
ncbi:VOC family protein [Alteribacillus sp. HJP-4]|uniref:VOC family protein n=1 Tax=Alteribacillus sp. HJP-4 TaxID=2775394 RepID=UPI0035CD33FB